jgi:hypothetical protein
MGKGGSAHEAWRARVLDLTTLGYALRLWWKWLQHTEPNRMWTVQPSKNDRIIQAMFDVSVTV